MRLCIMSSTDWKEFQRREVSNEGMKIVLYMCIDQTMGKVKRSRTRRRQVTRYEEVKEGRQETV